MVINQGIISLGVISLGVISQAVTIQRSFDLSSQSLTVVLDDWFSVNDVLVMLFQGRAFSVLIFSGLMFSDLIVLGMPLNKGFFACD